MIDPRLARRYARALFDVANERGVADKIDDEYRDLRRVLDGHPELVDFLSSPRVSAAEKEAVLRKILGERVDVVLLEFLLLLRRKGRFVLVHEVGAGYREIVEESRNRTTARVTSAVSLTDTEQDRLRSALEARVGKTVTLEQFVDPAVIGGVAVVIEGKIIDDTVRHHLSVLRDQLRNVPVHMTAEGV